jgi:hypothetical protein
MKDLGIFKAAIVLLAVTAAGCGMPGGTPSAGPVSSAARQAVAPLAAPDAANKKFAGTYNGTIAWSIGGQTLSGTLSTILRFQLKNISGPFRMTINGHTKNYRLYGRIKSKTTEEAQIVFLIYNPKGGYLTGTGTIGNGTFAGKAQSAPAGDQPSSSINFTATKNQ